MKVLQLSSEMGWRGGERQVGFLVSHLTAKSVETLVVGRKGSALENFCLNENVRFIPLRLRNSIDIGSAIGLKRICEDQSIDLINAQTAIAHSVAVLSSALGNKVPIVLTRRVSFQPGSSWFTRWKYNHPSIRRIICVSNKTKEVVAKIVSDRSKLVTVYSGVDLEQFQTPESDQLKERYGIPNGVFRIGNAAALTYEKDLATFIRTIDRLRKNGYVVHGIISGKGPLEAELKSLAASKGLESTITFTGHVTDIHNVIYYLDVFMMTSQEEGIGSAILDAYATGTTVVTTAAGGIPELVVDGQTGLIAEVGDDETLARHVEGLIVNPGKKQSLAEAGLNRVKQFSVTITAEKTLEVYQQVISEFTQASPDKSR